VTRALPFLVAALALAGCRQDMHDQPRHEPLERSAFFADGRSARPRVPGTVARGERPLDEHLHTGRVGGELATTFPMEITREVMERGRERYEVFCSPCHGYTGAGNGMIVQRGMKQPPSLLIDRLRDAPPGYHFEVITRGFGVMFDYADRIAVQDRWAIVAYIQALELSGTAVAAELAEEDRAQLAD
jgi:hypothetical protein